MCMLYYYKKKSGIFNYIWRWSQLNICIPQEQKTYIESVSDKIHQNVKWLIFFFFWSFFSNSCVFYNGYYFFNNGIHMHIIFQRKKLMLELFTQNGHMQCSVIVKQTQIPCLEGTRSRKAWDGGHRGIFITASGFGFNFSGSPGKAIVLHFLSHFLQSPFHWGEHGR